MSDFIHIPVEYPMPHSPAHERDVVSCFLNNPETFDDFPHVTEEHFHMPDTRTVFKFAAEMRAKSNFQITDFSTLIEEINKRGLMDAIGGYSGLMGIVERPSFPMHLPAHVEKLNHYLAKRLAIHAGKELVRSAFEDEIEDMIEAASGPITAVHDALTAARPVVSTKGIIIQSFEAYEARLRGNESPMGMPTLPEIDELIRGVHPGRVYLIGATTGGGKSVLSSQIITLQSLKGIPVLEINYEMRERDSMDRKIIQMSRVPSGAFMDPLTYARENDVPPINNGFLTALKRTRDGLANAPLYIRKPHNRQLRTLLAMIRKEVRNNGIKVVAIDYLQKIRCKADSREAEMTEISGALFDLAGELGIAVLLLTQINADGDSKHGIVTLEDCDGYLLIEREKNKDAENFGQHYHILLAKDRHCGNSGQKIPLIFDPNLVRFVHGFVERKKKLTTPQKKSGF